MEAPWAVALASACEVAEIVTPPSALMVWFPPRVAETTGVTVATAEAALPDARSEPEAAVALASPLLSSHAVTETFVAWAWVPAPTEPSRWALVEPSEVATDSTTPMPAMPPNARARGEETARFELRALTEALPPSWDPEPMYAST